ncbi:MAG: glycosyltransferase family 2 protein [Pseudomonadota bacterium]
MRTSALSNVQHAPHNPCIIVPVYNHGDGIRLVCDSLSRYQLTTLLVNDGCDAPCLAVLTQLDMQYEWVHLLHFDTNRGKGAAVCAGFHWAAEQGFSHALQVDADGQHDLNDLPRFLEVSRAQPSAVVTGARVADGVSALRHYGRKLTDWLVWLQTLSMSIEDSMCGYRLYPLPATLELLRGHRVGQRMDFDTDILVRLSWRGTPIEQIRTTVIYREQIPSHFRMFRDNTRITRMHIMLLLGMLLRSPVLLGRKFSRG